VALRGPCRFPGHPRLWIGNRRPYLQPHCFLARSM